MRIFRFLAIVVVCFLLGVGIWRVADLGYLHQWRMLSLSPQEKTQYLSAAGNASTQHPVRITKPCDYSKPEFGFFARRPAGIVDCLQKADLYADAYGRTTYVLDSAGNVWIWDYTVGAYTTLARMIVWPGAGLVIGLIIALLLRAS